MEGCGAVHVERGLVRIEFWSLTFFYIASRLLPSGKFLCSFRSLFLHEKGDLCVSTIIDLDVHHMAH